jgi:excisionase family DNA binding protein
MQDTERRVAPIERLLYSLDQASEALGGLGRTSIFELIKEGELKVVRIGRRTFISQQALAEFVHRTELKSEVRNEAS